MKISKRILSLALSALMLMSMFTMVIGISSSAAADVWDGTTVATAFSGGDGTEESPYIIKTASELAYMAKQVNAGTDVEAYYKLGADIILNENQLSDSYTPNGTFSRGAASDGRAKWTPIGNSSNNFKGVFDGDGHTVSGIYSDAGIGGLFGYISGAKISNLNYVDFLTTGTNQAYGGLVGSTSGNCYITDVTCDGFVTFVTNANATGIFVGSLSGNVYFTNCVSKGRVYATTNNGVNNGWCANQHSSGGGLVGSLNQNAEAYFVNCVNYATVYGSNAGGFVGQTANCNQNGGWASFTDCINYGDCTTLTYGAWNTLREPGCAGGFLGLGTKGGLMIFTRCANEGNITGHVFAGGFIGRLKSQSWLGNTFNHSMTNCFNTGAISVSVTAEEYVAKAESSSNTDVQAMAADVENGTALLANDYIGYLAASGHTRDTNNWTIADSCYYVDNGLAQPISYAESEKLVITGSPVASDLTAYQSGTWLGTENSLWVVKAGQNPTLTLVAPAEEETEPEFKVSAASVTLQSNLQANYKVNKNLFETAGYSAPYMTFTLNGKTTRVDDFDVVDNYYVFRFADIAPDKMNDTITSVLYATKNEENVQFEKEYSIAEYCYNQLAKEEVQANEKLRTLLVDMLNYGAASQNYTGYNTANLVNADLDDAQKGWGTSGAPTLTDSLNTAAKTVENATATWIGAALRLTDRVEMKFIIDTASIDGLTVKFTNAAGDVEHATVASDTFERRAAGGYYVYFDGFDASQMREVVYVTAYNGDTAVSNTIAYSVETYAYAKQNSSVPNLGALVIAMMKYGNAAKAYASV